MLVYNTENNKENSLTTNKVTVTIPHEIVTQLNQIKNELKVSMSAIYKEDLEVYLERKEIEKWEQGVKLARQDKQYIRFVNDCLDTKVDLYEY